MPLLSRTQRGTATSPASLASIAGLSNLPAGLYEITATVYFSGAAPTVSQPAVPATGVAQYNNNAFPVVVTVSGGTVSGIAVNGTATGLTTGAINVPTNGTITLTYTVAPTWVWAAAPSVEVAPIVGVDDDNFFLFVDGAIGPAILAPAVLNQPNTERFIAQVVSSITIGTGGGGTTGSIYRASITANPVSAMSEIPVT